MHIYVGNIRGTSADLYTFFREFVKRAESFRVLQRTARRPGVRYAVLEIEPDALAAKAVRKMDGKTLLGAPVEVREFSNRYCANERRSLHWRDRPWQHVERRQTERRFTPVRTPSAPAERIVDEAFVWNDRAYVR